MKNTTTGYIYNVETSEIIFEITGNVCADVEAKADELGYMGVDDYGLSYASHELYRTTSTEDVSA